MADGEGYTPALGQLLVVLAVALVLLLVVKVRHMARATLRLFRQVRVIEEERQNIVLDLAAQAAGVVAQAQLEVVVQGVLRILVVLAVLVLNLVFLASQHTMPVVEEEVEILLADLVQD